MVCIVRRTVITGRILYSFFLLGLVHKARPEATESVSFDAAKNKEERTFVRKRPFLDMSASGDSSNQSGTVAVDSERMDV